MKKYNKFLIMLFCILALCLAPVDSISCLTGTTHVEAKTKAGDYSISINTSVTTSQARKIHKYMSAGKSVDLKVAASSKKTATKQVNALAKLVAKYNKRGVIFQYNYQKKYGKRYIFQITRSYGKLYKYTLTLTDNMLKKARRIIAESPVNAIMDAKAMYPDEQEALQHLIYHCAVVRVVNYEDGENWIFTGSNDTLTTEAFDIFTYSMAKELVVIKEPGSFSDDPPGELMSYEEFVAANPNIVEDVLNMEKSAYVDTSLARVMEAYEIFAPLMSGKFCDYSDARKLLVIDTADLFGCNIAYDEYYDVFGNNHYTSNKDATDKMGCSYRTGGNDFAANYKGIVRLMKGTAYGDCGAFADFEELLFKQYGMQVCQNSVSGYMHIWTVVKAKNSAGKVLWIPFDYGIGAESFIATEPYFETENAKYKYYLSGIKGNPKKKNYVNTELN